MGDSIHLVYTCMVGVGICVTKRSDDRLVGRPHKETFVFECSCINQDLR